MQGMGNSGDDMISLDNPFICTGGYQVILTNNLDRKLWRSAELPFKIWREKHLARDAWAHPEANGNPYTVTIIMTFYDDPADGNTALKCGMALFTILLKLANERDYYRGEQRRDN